MLILAPENKFSRDYQAARRRFLKAAIKRDAVMSTLPLQAEESAAADLTTDIAWFGSQNPKKALIVVSGAHGVEGFAGSAVQLATLEHMPELPEDTALLLVHVLNPYGMQNLRRFNGNNVDLNRNFHFASTDTSRDNPGYEELDALLNPPNPPKADAFALKFLLKQFRLGNKAITQAVAGGQYQFPKGIFYGGSELEPEIATYLAWLKESTLGDVEKMMVIDIHTGLGGLGEQSLFLRSSTTDYKDLAKTLRLPVNLGGKGSGGMNYDHDGGSSGLYPFLFPEAAINCVTVEYGTYSGKQLLTALRAENQHHHYGDQKLSHWSKKRLKEAFCPHPDIWRKQVVTQGIELIDRAVKAL